MDLPKNRMPLAVGVAAAGALAIAMVTVVWPALMRPEPPLEEAGEDGLRIRVVQPPKAATRASGLLDVGLSEAAQGMTKGRGALLVHTPAMKPAADLRPRVAPTKIVQTDAPEDALPPPERMDDPWARDAARRDRFERAQNRHWEEERLARESRDEHAAWARETSARGRWEEELERDRHDDRDAPPPHEEREPRRERW